MIHFYSRVTFPLLQNARAEIKLQLVLDHITIEAHFHHMREKKKLKKLIIMRYQVIIMRLKSQNYEIRRRSRNYD